MEDSLEWQNISLEIKNTAKNGEKHLSKRKTILHNISSKIEPGRMMALLGASGGGKTSLLKILSGRVPCEFYTSGVVKYRNKERDDSFIDTVSFLEQENTYSEYFDTYSFLKFNTECLEGNPAFDIDYLIDTLKLSKSKFTKLNKLSGGERKRVIIANELLSNKKVIFLDEPTTGLDSHLALKVILFLSKVVKEKKLIMIVSIHQPSTTILNLFDDFSFINDGKFIYSGKMSECKEFFESKGMIAPPFITFPEFLFELASDNSFFEEINRLKPSFEKLIPGDAQPVINSTRSKNKTSMKIRFKRIKALFKRQFMLYFHRQNRTKLLFSLLGSFFMFGALLFIFKIPFEEIYNKSSIPQEYKKLLTAEITKVKLSEFLNLFTFFAFGFYISSVNISLFEYKVNKEEVQRGLFSFTELILVSFIINLVLSYVLFLGISLSLILFISKEFNYFLKNACLLPLFLLLRLYFIISLFETEMFYSLVNSLIILATHIDKITGVLNLNEKAPFLTYLARSLKLLPENLLIQYLIFDLKKPNKKIPPQILALINLGTKNSVDIYKSDDFFDFDKNMRLLVLLGGFVLTLIFIGSILLFRMKYSRYVRMKLSNHKK